MILVVLLHCSNWAETCLNHGHSTFWAHLNFFFFPMRMPLFFLMSGMLASSALQKSPEGAARRAAGGYYLYLSWTLIFAARLALPFARGAHEPPTADEIAVSLLLPTSFWYLWALPVFFLVSYWLVDRLGRRAVWALVPLAGLSACHPLVGSLAGDLLEKPLGPVMLGSAAAYLFWFYLGLFSRGLWSELMERATPARLLVGTTAWALLLAGALRLGIDEAARLVIGGAALFTVAQATGLANLEGRVAKLFRSIGRETLPIYVMHPFALGGVTAVLKLAHLSVAGRLASAVAVLAVPVSTVAVIAACMLAGRAIVASPLAFLLEAPQWLVAGQSRHVSRLRR